MLRRQQSLFFLSSFILYFTGNGLHPLLPHFAGGFGASATVMGVFLAALSAANASGALLASRLMGRYRPRTLYVAGGAVGVPALAALVWAPALWVVIVATAAVWFSGGFVMAIVQVLTGLTVSAERRGRAFGLIFLASPVASIFGGAALGAIVNDLGYAPGFVVLAFMWAVIPVAGLALDGGLPVGQRGPSGQNGSAEQNEAARVAGLGRSFYLLLGSGLAVAAAIHMRSVAAFMQMQSAGFSPAAISSTTVVAGVVTAPVAYFTSSFSDRFAAQGPGGRRTFMLGAMAVVGLALIPFAFAGEVWHFAAGLALLLAATAVLRPATTAVAADLLPPAALQRALPLIEAGVMGVGIGASALAGFVLEHTNAAGVTVFSVALLVLGGVALASLRLGGAPAEAAPVQAAPVGAAPVGAASFEAGPGLAACVAC